MQRLADIWVMDPKVQFVDDLKASTGNAALTRPWRGRRQWAVPLYIRAC